jgi:topoisomerase-4 subunit A
MVMEKEDKLLSMQGLYENYFLDYASYVIMERAVPALLDGLKPVQRRILHSMREMDDGRFHKVANIIGQTMQYHPHGDAAIGDALVNMGQKGLLIDCQGNWGDTRTGDSAAAPRYIEARLTKFALEVLFNAQTTHWQLSYDGRKKEPIHLPVKFPLVLSEGVEGIAVGLSTKILPHNFKELLQACIAILQNKPFEIYPDFQTGGMIDVGDYNKGQRGGKVRVRAKIEAIDKKFVAVREIPYGTTTGSIIESILKANDKGVIKIKKVVDNTAQDVEILIELAPNTSPDVTIDALYAFTDCEISISPNACVIYENKPHFMNVDEIIRISTDHTRNLLKWELEIKLGELVEKWHFANLEKIFIENRIYHDIEECETWESVLETIDIGMRKFIADPDEPIVSGDTRVRLLRPFVLDDILRLTEIKIKRISKYNEFKAEELIASLIDEMNQVKQDLANLTEYTIAWYKMLLEKYGKGKERKTQITVFDTIQATQVVAANARLYINRDEGFMGYGLKKDEFVMECADIDDIIVFRKDGKCVVSRMGEKVFVGKNIIHAAVWRKGDARTTYNMIYLDGESKKTFSKRFQVDAIIRDKEYDLTSGAPGSQLLYFSANPNGEAEIVNVHLNPRCSARIKQFEFNFAELEIKGRGAKGNTLTKYPVKKIDLKEQGKSTLGARKIWYDELVGRLNTDGRGRFLGRFDTGDLILLVYHNGNYELSDFEITNRYQNADIAILQKWNPDQVITSVYFDGERSRSMIKRFKIETSTLNTRFYFLPEHPKTKLLFVSAHPEPKISYKIKVNSKFIESELSLHNLIDVKGWKSLGNKISDHMLTAINDISPKLLNTEENNEKATEESGDLTKVSENAEKNQRANPEKDQKTLKDKDQESENDPEKKDTGEKYKPGTTIEFDIDEFGQISLF